MPKKQKPAKPYPEYPLTPMANGQWCKRIKNKLYYFGTWADPDAALKKYLDEVDDLQAGRTPRRVGDVRITVKQLCDAFYESKENRFKSGELSQTMLSGYYRACKGIVAYFGKNQIVEELKPLDFQRFRDHLSKGVGLVTLSNRIQHARIVFRWASEEDLIEHPLKFGSGFKKPKRLHLLAEQQGKPQKQFAASEIRTILAKAKQPLKSMILLGINCGFGQTDCARLPLKAVDLATGWIDFPRPKTGRPRRCPLWPETIAALKEAIATRPNPRDESLSHLTFITRKGDMFVRATEKGTNIDGVAQEMAKLLKLTDLSGNGRSFYSLRHTFETIGGDTADQIATDFLMGHAPDSSDMAAVYRKTVFAARLERVVNHVRAWLFPKPLTKGAAKRKTPANKRRSK